MSLKMGSRQGSARSPLDKRVPLNPRYASVQSKVKTGMTVDKLKFVTTREHLRRRDEPYYRITPSQLQELFAEYEQDSREEVQDFRDHRDPDHHGPRVVVHDSEAEPEYEKPYLILDLRTPAEFEKTHIVQARCFEAKLLNQDRMTPELYRYRNKEGGLIILYGNDERIACKAATTLIHRGFENIFLLSGGLELFARMFPSFVEGANPQPPQETKEGGSSHGTSYGQHGAMGEGQRHGQRVDSGLQPQMRHSQLQHSAGRGRLGTPSSSAMTVRSTKSVTSMGSKLGSDVNARGKGSRAEWTGSMVGPASGYRLGGVRASPSGQFMGGEGRKYDGAFGHREGQTAAVSTASPASRRIEDARGTRDGEVSRGSTMSVADSIISRAMARRGRW